MNACDNGLCSRGVALNKIKEDAIKITTAKRLSLITQQELRIFEQTDYVHNPTISK
jgi:hypothetical protein